MNLIKGVFNSYFFNPEPLPNTFLPGSISLSDKIISILIFTLKNIEAD